VSSFSAQVAEKLRGHAVMLASRPRGGVRSDVVAGSTRGFLHGILDALWPAGSGDSLHIVTILGAGLDEACEFEADCSRSNVQILQDVARAGALLDQAETGCAGAEVLMVESMGILVGQGQTMAARSESGHQGGTG